MQSGRYSFEGTPEEAHRVYIHMPPGYFAPARAQPPRFREGRQSSRHFGRDQGLPPARTGEGPPPGTLVCTLMQDGETGDWLGEDAEGNPLVVSSSGAGLEVRTRAPPREDGGGNDQQRVAVNVPTQEFGESAGNASEHDRRLALRGARARDEWIRTGRVRDEAALIGDYQRRINEHYQRR